MRRFPSTSKSGLRRVGLAAAGYPAGPDGSRGDGIGAPGLIPRPDRTHPRKAWPFRGFFVRAGKRATGERPGLDGRPDQRLRLIEAGHPIPDAEEASAHALEPGERRLMLVSGGGAASAHDVRSGRNRPDCGQGDPAWPRPKRASGLGARRKARPRSRPRKSPAQGGRRQACRWGLWAAPSPLPGRTMGGGLTAGAVSFGAWDGGFPEPGGWMGGDRPTLKAAPRLGQSRGRGAAWGARGTPKAGIRPCAAGASRSARSSPPCRSA